MGVEARVPFAMGKDEGANVVFRLASDLSQLGAQLGHALPFFFLC